MEILWHGNSCFTLKCKELTLVINPDKQAGALKGDIVLSSLKSGLEKIEGEKRVFDWPGEYETNGVAISAIPAWTKSKSKELSEGEGETTILFYVEMEDVKICHLGELGHVLTSDMVNLIGDVDILLVSVGDKSNLGAKKATEVIESIDPRVVIPMGEAHPGPFLKEIGCESFTVEDKFAVKGESDLPEDKRLYVVLNKV